MKKWCLVALAGALLVALCLSAYGQTAPKPRRLKKAVRELAPREKSIRAARLLLLMRWYLAEGDMKKATKAYDELKRHHRDAEMGAVDDEKYTGDIMDTWQLGQNTVCPMLREVKIGKDPKKLIASFGKPGLAKLRARLVKLMRDYEEKVVVYIDVVDIADGVPYKWRMTEYAIAQAFEFANPDNKEKFKKEWRKRYAGKENKENWEKYSKAQKKKYLENKYKRLRKEKGVSKLNYSHIKVLQYEPEPKPKKGAKKAGKPLTSKPAAQAEPKAAYWVDPRDLGDYLILGKGKYKAGKKSIYFGNTVACSSIGMLEVSVIRRVGGKLIKKLKEPKTRRSYTIGGQDGAHNRCMTELAKNVAKKVVILPVFRSKKKRKAQ